KHRLASLIPGNSKDFRSSRSVGQRLGMFRKRIAVRHVLMTHHARTSRRAGYGRHQRVREIVITPCDYLEVCVRHLVKRQLAGTHLGSPRYHRRLAGSNEQTDLVVAGFVGDQSRRTSLEVYEIGSRKPVGWLVLRGGLRSWQAKIEWNSAHKPCRHKIGRI